MSIVTKEYNSQVVEFDLTNDVMVSLTDMAKANGKRVSDWKDLPSTKSYLEALEKSDTRKSHIVIRKGGDSQLPLPTRKAPCFSYGECVKVG